MDQVKIGKFIAERRKNANYTQLQLAEKLGITDRAISKWETGKSMPDSSIMLELCGVLGITVNDLLSGEVVTMDQYNKHLEDNLLEMVKAKEEKDRQLLKMELVMGIVAIIPLLVAVGIVLAIPMEEWAAGLLVGLSMIPLLVAAPFAIMIEQKAGYYHCQECGNKYVPKYANVFLAPHMGTTRYMRCPKCGKKSWQKKALNKE